MKATASSGDHDRLLTPAEVAAMFRVDPKTLRRWAADGLIPYGFTPGGRRRYPEAAVLALLDRPGR